LIARRFFVIHTKNSILEPDPVQDASTINPDLLQIQVQPPNKVSASNDVINWSEWLNLSDPTHSCTDEVLPSTAMCKSMTNDNLLPGSISSTVHENPAISLSKSVTSIDGSTSVAEEVSPEDNSSISRAELDQPMEHDVHPVLAAKTNRCSGPPAGSKKKKHSLKNTKAKRPRSVTKVGSTLDKRLLISKSLDVCKVVPGTVASHSTDGPLSVMGHPGGAQMWSLFGPGNEKALQEVKFLYIFQLTKMTSRLDLARFLEIQSNLWQTGRFWNPEPLCLSVTENPPTDRSCVGIFRYIQDLGEEDQINVVRRRFAQIRLHLTFVHLCMEKEKNLCDLNKRKVPSHAIDSLLGLGDGRHPTNPLKAKERQDFINNNAWGKRWFLISHHIGWGSLIIWNNIDTAMYVKLIPRSSPFGESC
jgi:hypothetical protein